MLLLLHQLVLYEVIFDVRQRAPQAGSHIKSRQRRGVLRGRTA